MCQNTDALTSFYIIKSFDSLAVHGFCSKTDVIWAIIDGTEGASEHTLKNSTIPILAVSKSGVSRMLNNHLLGPVWIPSFFSDSGSVSAFFLLVPIKADFPQFWELGHIVTLLI
jgi:hypothetical protein